MPHALDVLEEAGHPDYGAIARMEHQEQQERPDAAFLPHDDEQVREACTECSGARVIPLRPDEKGAQSVSAPADGEAPGTPEEREEQSDPGVPDEPIEGVVLPPEPDEPPLPWHARTQRRPIVARWVRNAQERRMAAEWFARSVGYRVAFHTLRVPLNTVRTLTYSPRGIGRSVSSAFRWLTDAEGRPLRTAAVQTTSTSDYVTLERIRKERVKTRGLVAVFGAAGTLIGWYVGSQFIPHLGLFILVVAVLAAGVYGRGLDKPLIDDPMISNPAAAKLTSHMVVEALGALGIAEINKALHPKHGKGIGFANPIHRDGPGWRADVDLPLGVTVTDIMDKRDRLASGLRRPLGAVWPEPDPKVHAGRMVLWVGYEDMNTARQAPWPLLKRGKVSVFDPLPFGTDQRGRPVDLPVMYSNLLIGALPGAGKTFSLRVPLLGAALDPICELRVFELKGSGDLSSLEKVAHEYASGPADDDTLQACLDALREAVADVKRRARTIAKLPKDLAREAKVTPEIAAKRSLRLHPKVIAIDEVQNLFLSEYGKEAAELCTFLIKIGRAFGVMLWLATQRPDKDSLPTGVTANIGTRFCLRVMSHVENDMILGTSAHQNGIRATTFTTLDLGIGYLVGAGPEPRVVHTYNIDGTQAEKVTDRARVLRAQAGTLSGYALGDEPEAAPSTPRGDLLEDVSAVLNGDDDKVWSVTLIERLRELRPGAYDGLTTTAFGSQMNASYGLKTQDVWGVVDGREVNWKGLAREDVLRAVEKRRASV